MKLVALTAFRIAAFDFGTSKAPSGDPRASPPTSSSRPWGHPRAADRRPRQGPRALGTEARDGRPRPPRDVPARPDQSHVEPARQGPPPEAGPLPSDAARTQGTHGHGL